MSALSAEAPVADDLDRLVALLLVRGDLTEPALERGRRAAAGGAVRLDRALNRLGLVADAALLSAWSEVSGLPVVSAAETAASPPPGHLLQPAFLRHARCLPLDADATRVILAVEDPLDPFVPAAIAAKTGLSVERRLISGRDLDAALERLPTETPPSPTLAEATDPGLADDVERLRDLASDAPVIRLVNALIERAVDLRASDIHLAATAHGARLRYRIDGGLRDAEPPATALYPAVVSRIKIMAGLDIAERRLPQDGRIRAGFRGREIDLRVATMPHIHGEGVVLRLLDRAAVALDLPALGLAPATIAALSAALAAPHGMILVTGPTGSGKTTTLYAALRTIDGRERNIVTVEDPVEYHLEGVNQIQVARRIGFDFAQALRAVLRQDPDVVMVGEIRDRETAAVATQAALTGHLVLATVHTNTAAGALPRLVDMGVEPFLLASTVRAVLAQRLVRRLCPHCRAPAGPALRPAGHEAGQDRPAFVAVGCEACGGTGYRGRAALSNVLTASDTIRAAVTRGADEATIAAMATAEGMTSLETDGWRMVGAAVTTIAEVLRVTGER